MKKCPACGASAPDAATKCPSCQRELEGPAGKGGTLMGIPAEDLEAPSDDEEALDPSETSIAEESTAPEESDSDSQSAAGERGSKSTQFGLPAVDRDEPPEALQETDESSGEVPAVSPDEDPQKTGDWTGWQEKAEQNEAEQTGDWTGWKEDLGNEPSEGSVLSAWGIASDSSETSESPTGTQESSSHPEAVEEAEGGGPQPSNTHRTRMGMARVDAQGSEGSAESSPTLAAEQDATVRKRAPELPEQDATIRKSAPDLEGAESLGRSPSSPQNEAEAREQEDEPTREFQLDSLEEVEKHVRELESQDDESGSQSGDAGGDEQERASEKSPGARVLHKSTSSVTSDERKDGSESSLGASQSSPESMGPGSYRSTGSGSTGMRDSSGIEVSGNESRGPSLAEASDVDDEQEEGPGAVAGGGSRQTMLGMTSPATDAGDSEEESAADQQEAAREDSSFGADEGPTGFEVDEADGDLSLSEEVEESGFGSRLTDPGATSEESSSGEDVSPDAEIGASVVEESPTPQEESSKDLQAGGISGEQGEAEPPGGSSEPPDSDLPAEELLSGAVESDEEGDAPEAGTAGALESLDESRQPAPTTVPEGDEEFLEIEQDATADERAEETSDVFAAIEEDSADAFGDEDFEQVDVFEEEDEEFDFFDSDSGGAGEEVGIESMESDFPSAPSQSTQTPQASAEEERPDSSEEAPEPRTDERPESSGDEEETEEPSPESPESGETPPGSSDEQTGERADEESTPDSTPGVAAAPTGAPTPPTVEDDSGGEGVGALVQTVSGLVGGIMAGIFLAVQAVTQGLTGHFLILSLTGAAGIGAAASFLVPFLPLAKGIKGTVYMGMGVLVAALAVSSMLLVTGGLSVGPLVALIGSIFMIGAGLAGEIID